MLVLSIVGGVVLIIVAVLGLRWMAENVVIKSDNTNKTQLNGEVVETKSQ